MPRVAMVAYCAEHGLHGERGECFECGEPVEQIPYVSHAFHQRCMAEFKSNQAYVVMETTIRQLEGENETLREALHDAWAEAHGSHRAINPRDVNCRMHPCPRIRALLCSPTADEPGAKT